MAKYCQPEDGTVTVCGLCRIRSKLDGAFGTDRSVREDTEKQCERERERENESRATIRGSIGNPETTATEEGKERIRQ